VGAHLVGGGDIVMAITAHHKRVVLWSSRIVKPPTLDNVVLLRQNKRDVCNQISYLEMKEVRAPLAAPLRNPICARANSLFRCRNSLFSPE